MPRTDTSTSRTARDLHLLATALPSPSRGLARLGRSVALVRGAQDNAYDELLACHRKATERDEVRAVIGPTILP